MTLTSPLLKERQILPGDEVITVAAGFPTTVAPIIQYGAVPVFVDVAIPQYNIDPQLLEGAYSSKTKAVMLAHTLGNPFDLKAVKDFCDRHNLWLIEDNCDALGSVYTINGEEKLTGTIGDIGTSSFYPPHHMTMGEGGCVYTNNPKLNRLILSFRDWGRDCVCPSGKDNLCNPHHGQQSAQADPHDPPGQQQAQAHRCCHAAQIKHVLGKALIPAHPLGHRLDDAVPRVGDQPHVDGEGHPHPRQHDGQGQHRQIFRQAAGRRLIAAAAAAPVSTSSFWV